MTVEIRGISKQFGRNVVLNDFTLVFEQGHVYSIVGENGAGKSTLMKILAGIYAPNSGTILKDGEEIELASTSAAAAQGIAMVHQEHNLILDLTVLENVFLGREPVKRMGQIDWKKAKADYKRTSDELGIDIDANRSARNLSVAETKMVEILKACIGKPDVLIFDEPTAALGEEDVKTLARIVEELRADNKIVIYVSHRLAETFSMCDYVSVLKDGVLVGTWPTTDTNETELANRMVGREISDIFPVRSQTASCGAPALSVSKFGDGAHFFDVELEVHKGRILGVGGMNGHGQREFIRALFGLGRWTTGSLEVYGKNILRFRSPKDALDEKITFITDDRRNEGLAVTQSIVRNVGLPSIKQHTRMGVFSRKKESKRVAKIVERLDVKLTSVYEPARNLSGGNQQRLLFAKWLPVNPRILLVHEPTLGVDIGAKKEIYSIIRELTEEGMAVIMVTSDMIELLELSDDIAVFYEGRVAGVFSAEDCTEELVMHAALGLAEDEELPL